MESIGTASGAGHTLEQRSPWLRSVRAEAEQNIRPVWGRPLSSGSSR